MSFFKEYFSKNHYSIPLTVLVFCFCFAVLVWLNRSAVFCMDDLTVVFRNPYDFFHFWNKPDHGSFAACLPNQFLGFYLPDFLNVHPQDFLLSVGVKIRCFLFLILPYCAAELFSLTSKKRDFFPLIFLGFTLLLFNALKFSIVEFAMATAFFRMTVPIILWAVFWFCFSKNCSRKISVSSVIILSFVGLLLGNSSETMAFITLVSALVLLIFEAFNTSFKKKNLFKYIPFLFVIIGFLFLIFQPEFLYQLELKKQRFPDVTIISTLPLIFVYVKEFFVQIICRHWLSLAVAAAAFSYLAVKNKKGYSKSLVLALSLYVGLISFYFSLFFMGKTHYTGNFWLCHFDLQYIFETCMIVISAIPCGLAFRELIFKIRNNRKAKVGLAAVFLVVALFVGCNFYFVAKNYVEKTATVRKYMYVYDKMTLFWWKKEKTAVVPYLFDFGNVFSFMNGIDLPRKYTFYEDDDFHKCYMQTVYPNTESFGYKFTFPDEAYKLYYENGGVLSEDELSGKIFSKLKN